jgi:hypothetical protein
MVLSGKRRYLFGAPIVEPDAPLDWLRHLTEPLRTRLAYHDSDRILGCDVRLRDAWVSFVIDVVDDWRDCMSITALERLMDPLDRYVREAIADAQMLERELFPGINDGFVCITPHDYSGSMLGDFPFRLS